MCLRCKCIAYTEYSIHKKRNIHSETFNTKYIFHLLARLKAICCCKCKIIKYDKSNLDCKRELKTNNIINILLLHIFMEPLHSIFGWQIFASAFNQFFPFISGSFKCMWAYKCSKWLEWLEINWVESLAEWSLNKCLFETWITRNTNISFDFPAKMHILQPKRNVCAGYWTIWSVRCDQEMKVFCFVALNEVRNSFLAHLCIWKV